MLGMLWCGGRYMQQDAGSQTRLVGWLTGVEHCGGTP